MKLETLHIFFQSKKDDVIFFAFCTNHCRQNHTVFSACDPSSFSSLFGHTAFFFHLKFFFGLCVLSAVSFPEHNHL